MPAQQVHKQERFEHSLVVVIAFKISCLKNKVFENVSIINYISFDVFTKFPQRVPGRFLPDQVTKNSA